jgi:hypothetical protein
MSKFRHEINLLNGTLVGAVTASERVQFDPTQYSGTLTVWFEVVASISTGSSNVTLTDGTLTWVAGVFSSPTVTVLRGSVTGYSSVAQTYWLTSVANMTVKAARLVIIQDTGGDKLRKCETQIEIGSRATVTATGFPLGGTAPSNLQNPKYWYYDAAKWDNVTAIYFEATFSTASSKSSSGVYLQVADGAGDGFTGWLVPTPPNIGVATLSQTPVRLRTSDITPQLTSGRWYRLSGSSGQSKTGMNIYSAKIIIQQADVQNTLVSQTQAASYYQLTHAAGAAGGYSALGQSFQVGASNQVVTSVMLTVGISGVPTDYSYVEIVSTLGGTPLATSQPGSSSGANYMYQFLNPPTLNASTTYYVQIRRTVTDATNTWNFYIQTADVYAGGNYWVYSVAINWQSQPTWDLTFSVYGYSVSSLGITKLQPQYLIANTLLAAGTGLQTQLMNWDTNDWSGVANTYKLQACAANGSTSDVQLRTADDATLVATVTDPDNAGSGTATMP